MNLIFINLILKFEFYYPGGKGPTSPVAPKPSALSMLFSLSILVVVVSITVVVVDDELEDGTDGGGVLKGRLCFGGSSPIEPN